MEFSNYISYATISFLTITSPGAAILLAVNNAMSFDMRAVSLSTTGNIIGLFLLSTVAMFGVGILLKTSNIFFVILKIIGACYLVYLGIKQIANCHINLHLQKTGEKNKIYNGRKVFQKGFLVAATNPKPILFFTAVFPLFLEQNKSIYLQFTIMTGTFMFISFCSLMFYGYISQTAKAWFFDRYRLKIFFKISGMLFVLMGIGMLFI